MKSQFLLPLILLFAAIFPAGHSFSQNKDVATLPDVVIKAANSNSQVTAKVIRSFFQLFKGANEVTWTEKDQNYQVKFKMNNLENRALFLKDGQIVYHISYGFEKDLPAGMRKQIKTSSSYFDYSITHAINVQQDARNIWIVYLEGDKDLIVVRVENDNLERIEQYRKSYSVLNEPATVYTSLPDEETMKEKDAVH